jgi:hypothetical protein
MTAERILPNLLLDGFYALTLCVSAMFFIATQRATSARWSAGLRRVPEAFMCAIPVFALLMVPLVLIPGARSTLFPWTHPGTFDGLPAIAGKARYLNAPFVYARIAVVFVIWTVFARAFRRASLAQDRVGATPGASLRLHNRLDRLGAGFLVMFALTITAAAYDWIGSLDPSWSSTMFAVYVFAGVFVGGIAAVTAATVAMARRQPLRAAVGTAQLHDLGKLMFAFSIFWGYIFVCQYLLIWYGNIPEEITHFLSRTNGGWLPLFVANVLINFVVPFLGLLSVPAKTDPRRLALIAGVILVGRWLDLYIMIMPALWREPHFGVVEPLIAIAYGALLVMLFRFFVARAPLVPLHDPVLAADAGAAHHPVAGRHAA